MTKQQSCGIIYIVAANKSSNKLNNMCVAQLDRALATDQGVGSSNLLAHVLKGILIRECLFPFINSIFLRLSVFGKALSGGFQEPVLLR